MGQECGDSWYGNIGEFLWLELMKAATVYTAFAKELVRCNGIEELPDAADEALIMSHCGGNDGGGIHGEVDVGHGCTRMIEDEAERSATFDVAPPEICADDGCGRTVFLAVPQRAMLAQIALVKAAGFALFEVFIKDRESALDFILGELCV